MMFKTQHNAVFRDARSELIRIFLNVIN